MAALCDTYLFRKIWTALEREHPKCHHTPGCGTISDCQVRNMRGTGSADVREAEALKLIIVAEFQQVENVQVIAHWPSFHVGISGNEIADFLKFAGFSAESLRDRILDASCSAIVTTDGVWRGAKLLNLKAIVDKALDFCKEKGKPVTSCVVVQHLTVGEKVTSAADDQKGKRPCKSLQIALSEGRDMWWHELMASASNVCDPEWVDAEDPLFMLYTSGSTGKPKGVLHTVGGYMIYAATTSKYTFDLHEDDVYWCTADIGWITGHTYVCYGPLANGVTSVIFEGTPMFPDAGRLWDVVDKYKVTKFYTAPTAIRSLMKFGDSYVTKYNRSSLMILGTVGEPINPEAWHWYYRVVGNSNCAVVDTFWQTETGGHVITPLPGATKTKAGSATFPFFGIVPAILSDDGVEIEGPGQGYLVFKQAWPGMMRTVYGDHERFETTYFKKFPGFYCTGDALEICCSCVKILCSATSTVACSTNLTLAESATYSERDKGEAFTEDLVKELTLVVREKIGAFAQPDFMQNAPALPKTRSGKIMRRILRKIAVNDRNVGDTSTLADESVIDTLFNLRCPNA
ncbi:acetyl-CoA synthetase [Plakobranchus ocellatus]|uniref:acetate--CoA ligase n=1 Tax=Plakobranchus ocellatus TaxID=259542 RepID=A0AAV4BHD5_9GAST|nr:acetyl-CoA synthetase [Plakobranchus ocellatus]